MNSAASRRRVEDARSVQRPAAMHPLAGKSLLDGLVLDYGPIELLGRFFLKADAAARARGIELSFATLDELIAVNRRNSDTWRPLVTVFDPAFGALDADNTFALLGRNRNGDVVATQAARLYDWTRTNFAEQAATLGLFYPNPQRDRLPDERIDVTAASAKDIFGRVAYSGGVWFRPDYRGRFLTGILPRISRAFAFSRWYTDVTTTLMAESLVDKGVAARCGYTHIDWDVTLRNTRLGTFRCALLAMRTDQMLDDLGRFLKQIDAQVDGRIEDRAGQQPAAVGDATHR
jgi:hypothetical protein